jgi:rhodanese-related sulfurtransferase
MSIRRITPEQAQSLLRSGAALIDIRDADEHARERIPQARSAPLADIGKSALPIGNASAVIFHCRSGNRTASHAEKLGSSTACETYLLDGGLDAWKKAGLPMIMDSKQPLELMRQVQITAGLLVLCGVLLGSTVSPLFYGLAGFVGAGLTFAGATGTCAMARILKAMPWNRRLT